MKYQDQQLLKLAREKIQTCYKKNYHEIGAALRTRQGKEYAAVHLEATVGRIAVCAEAIAIGMAAAAGDTDIDTIVAVDRFGHVVSPCGMCRELIMDYAHNASVIVASEIGEIVVPVIVLLPNKFVRHDFEY